MSAPAADAKSIFGKALELEATARPAYLDEACAGDPALRARIDGLLAAHGQAGEFMRRPAKAAAAEITASYEAIAERPGTVIGPYKLMEQVGEGGMGLVFVAEQTQPIRRKVALKVIKPGMDSRQVVARFEAERQALAIMDHPNIARVLDAGETASGRPYFVMELVRGTPITGFCDQHHLTPRQRLELFLQVCRAVQHAHQKGVIHRDLKPSNVLVSRHDTTPVVKVIDFGVAKALGQELTDKTLFTGLAQMVGTPLYMSPEQAGMSDLDVDTRSDVYSLGVLLYELLTGTTPFSLDRFRAAGYDEIRRIIREEEPPKPSTRLSTLGLAASTVSTNRGTEPRKLSALVRGELDWVVMKAMEKDRNRRYESPGALAADVQRYLDDEPVQACPPSAWYRLRKLALRNKGTFAAVSAVTLAVSVAVVVLAISNVLIRQEQERTQEARDRAENSQQLAEIRAEQIRKDLEQLQAANTLIQSGRFHADGRNWTRAHADLTAAVRLRPDHSLARFERADLYTRMGLWDLAAHDYDAGFRLHEPPAPRQWTHYALLCAYLGDTDRYRQLCAQLPKRFGQEKEYLSWCNPLARAYCLAPLPDPDRAWVRRVAESGREWEPTAPWSRHAVVVAHYRVGEYEEVIKAVNESLLSDKGIDALAANHLVLALAQHRLGRAKEAGQALVTATRLIDQWADAVFRNTAGTTPFHSSFGDPDQLPWWDWVACLVLYRETKILIDGTPPPEDPRLLIGRARAFAVLGDKDQAAAVCARAAGLQPDNMQVRLACYEICASLGLEREAANHATALGINPGAVPVVREGRRLFGHDRGVYALAFSRDGLRLLSGGVDKTARLWDVPAGKEIRAFTGHESTVRFAVFSPDGQTFLTAGWDRTARIWELQSGKEPRRLFGHTTSVNGVAYLPDGRRALTAAGSMDGKDTALLEWDVASGKELRRLEGHTSLVNSVAVSPDGSRAVSGSFDRTVRVWDLETAKQLHCLRGHTGPVITVAVLPDGRRALSCSFDWTLRLWDLETGQELRRFVGHTNRVEGLAVSPDGKRVLSCGHDGTVRLWDLNTGKEVQRMTGHMGPVQVVVFSPDGRQAVSGGADGTIRFWDLLVAE